MGSSYWSSDVCSSDLDDNVAEVCRGRDVDLDLVELDVALLGDERVDVGEPRLGLGATALDRKSVVSGKSVSVRVDLGGRRIIKKKKKDRTNVQKRVKAIKENKDTYKKSNKKIR